MKIQNISVIKFDSVKDNLGEFLSETFTNYPYDILKFSSELTEEDHKIIYANADGYKYSKNVVNEEDYDILSKKEEEEEDIKYEIIMCMGRKYMNKMYRQPKNNMSLLFILREKIDFQTNLLIALMSLVAVTKII